MSENIITMTLNGTTLSGWTDVSISRSMDALADSFSMTLTDRWEGISNILVPDQKCSIKIDGKLVMTGYLDKVGITVDPSSHIYKISGRSLTSDLVDCSAMNKPGTWNNRSPNSIISDLVQPFGLKVEFDANLGSKISKFSINAGESIFDAIVRIISERGAIALSTPEGNLLITNAGSKLSGTRLIYGKNVRSASGDFDAVNRFSDYLIKSQKSGDGDGWTKSNTEISAKAKDPGVTRYRPKMFTADSEMNRDVAQKKVSWEAQTRAGQSGKISCEVLGWFQADGSLWSPNLLASCLISPFRISPDSPLLINEITLSQSNEGTTTSLSLVDPVTYAPDPETTVKKKVKKDEFAWLN